MSNILLEKASIKDNAALLDSHTIISISEVLPINLSELEPDEKIQLRFQYQYFIRSLNFPVQIVLRFLNRDCEKYLHRKRMANVEKTIKNNYKKNYNDVLAESDEFKKWLKLFLELKVRPVLLCYFVVPVHSDTDLIKNPEAYVEALQLLNQRTNDCISRLSSIKFRARIRPKEKRSEWEKEQTKKILERKALIALQLFRKNRGYYSLNNFNSVKNAQYKIRDYIKKNFFDEILAEKKLSLQIERLDDSRISNLFDSYCEDFVVLNKSRLHKYYSLRELFNIWVKKGD